ncbi:AraC-like DNA-binding protein [Bradyrhizobium sp. USDA 4515]
MDPFLDLIQLLRPRATLWGGIEGRGRWAVSFRGRGDLLFCWLERGACQLIRPDGAPLLLDQGDFALIRADHDFVLASDSQVVPQDSEAMVSTTGKRLLNVGAGSEAPVKLRGGRFVFDTANEDLLAGLMPSFVHIANDDTTSSWRVRSLLSLNLSESSQPGPASDFVITRLMELTFVEILRGVVPETARKLKGLLAGLNDPVIARALVAMHEDSAKNWTLADLARLCGVSRSSLTGRFRSVVGMAPMGYLQQWRMAVAKDALRRGHKSVGEIGLAIGFQSPSAFSTAFTRFTGISPTAFAALESQTPS